MSVRLDAETERLVNRLARERKRTKSEILREAIASLARRDAGDSPPRSPYEAIAHLLGCADSDGARLSEETGRKFTELVQGRARARRSR
ncbi:MAG: ribbon-helix-helix protein, CopG family [Candidatus Rokuibacteriota bacterium]